MQTSIHAVPSGLRHTLNEEYLAWRWRQNVFGDCSQVAGQVTHHGIIDHSAVVTIEQLSTSLLPTFLVSSQHLPQTMTCIGMKILGKLLHSSVGSLGIMCVIASTCIYTCTLEIQEYT